MRPWDRAGSPGRLSLVIAETSAPMHRITAATRQKVRDRGPSTGAGTQRVPTHYRPHDELWRRTCATNSRGLPKCLGADATLLRLRPTRPMRLPLAALLRPTRLPLAANMPAYPPPQAPAQGQPPPPAASPNQPWVERMRQSRAAVHLPAEEPPLPQNLALEDIEDVAAAGA